MEKKNILLTIRDRHIQDGEADSSELMTTGTFIGTPDDFTLCYNEQDDALRSCVTTVRVEGQERVTMVRTGSSMAELIIEKHKRHNCHYNTPFGSFILGVYAKEIVSKVLPDEACGAVSFRYTLDFNSANSTENELNILFKEATSNVPDC